MRHEEHKYIPNAYDILIVCIHYYYLKTEARLMRLRLTKSNVAECLICRLVFGIHIIHLWYTFIGSEFAPKVILKS